MVRLPDPSRDFVNDYIVVRRVSAQQATETNDRMVFFGFSKRARGGGNFECARYTDNLDVVLTCAGTHQSVVSASQQTVSDEFVESGYNNPEAKPRRTEIAGARLTPNLFFGGFLRVGSCPERSRRIFPW